MYISEREYIHWSGSYQPRRIFCLTKNNPSKDHFVKQNGTVVKRKIKTKKEEGGSILIRYAKIQDKLHWVYPKKTKKENDHGDI